MTLGSSDRLLLVGYILFLSQKIRSTQLFLQPFSLPSNFFHRELSFISYVRKNLLRIHILCWILYRNHVLVHLHTTPHSSINFQKYHCLLEFLPVMTPNIVYSLGWTKRTDCKLFPFITSIASSKCIYIKPQEYTLISSIEMNLVILIFYAKGGGVVVFLWKKRSNSILCKVTWTQIRIFLHYNSIIFTLYKQRVRNMFISYTVPSFKWILITKTSPEPTNSESLYLVQLLFTQFRC